jgi:hypothetical protein
MAITTGVGGRFLVDEFNLSGSTGAARRLQYSAGQQDTSTIQDEGMRRNALVRDGAIDWTAFWDDAAGASVPVLSELPTADRQVSLLHRSTRGATAWSETAKQVTYAPDRSNDGALTLDIATVANNTGVEGGHTLTAGIENSTGSENLAGVDDQGTATTTNFGLQAYLHVVSFTGTSVTVTIQDSDDDGAGDAYAAITGAAFTAAAGATFERIQTGRTQAVKRWMRLALTGTYSDVDLCVVVIRNQVSRTF